jgi:hypothetical protein
LHGDQRPLIPCLHTGVGDEVGPCRLAGGGCAVEDQTEGEVLNDGSRHRRVLGPHARERSERVVEAGAARQVPEVVGVGRIADRYFEGRERQGLRTDRANK